jgi:hypothetical protein
LCGIEPLTKCTLRLPPESLYHREPLSLGEACERGLLRLRPRPYA